MEGNYSCGVFLGWKVVEDDGGVCVVYVALMLVCLPSLVPIPVL